MRSLPILAATLALVVAAPAVACSYSQVPEAVGDGSARFFAKHMATAAATVDLVLVEDDGIQPMDAPSTSILTLRTVARLKGNGPDRFSLFGQGLTLRPEAEQVFKAPLEHFTDEEGRVTPYPYNEERPGRLFPQLRTASEPQVTMTSCSPSPIAGQTGRFYVVMRDANGRLLGDVPLHGRARNASFAFVPVRLDRDDPWLRAVLAATYDVPATEGPAVLHLRAGTDPARVQAALRRAGVAVTAAYVASGDWLDEVRPADGEARSPWLSLAVPLVTKRNKGGLGSADHGAAEFLRGRLGFEQTYGGYGYEVAQAYTASVRRKQEVKSASPRLTAIALAGPAEAVAALAREPFAEAVRPLPARKTGLPQLPGQTEAERFAAQQTIEREIWLLNGGDGNPQGTLPAKRP